MVSNVWIEVPAGPGRDSKYVRGSEIIEVFVRTSQGESYGKKYSRSTVKITQARTDSDAGTTPESLPLWEFEAQQSADRAARRLMAALAAGTASVVYLDDEGDVRADHLSTAAFGGV